MTACNAVLPSSQGQPLVLWLPNEEGVVGLHGVYPMQACGVIVDTNQHVYFHHRGCKASLVISRNATPVFSSEHLDAEEYCFVLVRRWVQSHLLGKEPTVTRIIGRRPVRMTLSEARCQLSISRA
jgi:hypothetical protein